MDKFKSEPDLKYSKAVKGVAEMSSYRVVGETNSFAAKYPQLLKEWHWEKNQELGISPFEIGPGSGTKVYWACNKH